MLFIFNNSIRDRRLRKSLAVLMSVAMLFSLSGLGTAFNVKTAKAASVTIRCSSVYRSGGDKATAYVYSDTDGDIYYKVSTESSAPAASDIVSGGVKAANQAVADKVTDFVINSGGMASGALYAHIVVVSGDDISNVQTIKMPANVYFSDDFETYSEGANSGTCYLGLDAGKKTVNTIAGSKRYCLTGDVQSNRLGMGDGTRIIIAEATIRFDSESPSAVFGISYNSNLYFYGYSAGVEIASGTWKTIVKDKEPITLTKAGTAVKDRDYHVRLVYDYFGKDSVSGDDSTPMYDVYIDDVKVNDEPLPASGHWYSGLSMSSSAGQTTYFDDIKYYLPSTNNNRTTMVEYNPVTATYTKAQNIELTSKLPGKDIYYTTDGSCPTLDISPSSATKKYTAPFSVGTDNTVVRAMIVADGKAESLAYNETYSFVDTPSIRVGTVYRSSGTAANAYIYSDTAGDIYYKINTDSESPTADDIVENGTKASVSATEDAVTVFNMNNAPGFAAGSVYAHIALKDRDGTLSNVKTVLMPSNIYFCEDFETYSEGAYDQTSFLGLEAGKKTVNTIAGSKRYVLTGDVAGGRSNIGDGTRILVLEGTIRFDSDNPSAKFGISRHNYGGSFITYMAGVEIDAGTWKAIAGEQEPVILTKAGTAVKDRDYNVRIVYDWRGDDSKSGENDIPEYDVYIDNIKMNDVPLKGYTRNYSGIYMTSSAGQTTYFDNIRYYLPSTDNNETTLVEYKPVTATFTVAQDIELTTKLPGRDIYYTTDGSYPTLDISASSATKKYTAPFSVGPDNTIVRAMIVKDGKAESIAYKETYSFVDKPTIASGFVYRSSESGAMAYLYSDTAGDIYYKIDTDSTSPEASDIEANGTKSSVKAVEDSVVDFNMNYAPGLTGGRVYVHMAVKDKDGTYSNVVTNVMSYNRYVSDDFETYKENVASQTFFFGLEADKRVVKTVAGSKRYALTGDVAGGRSNIGDGTRIHVLEGTIRFDSDNPSAKFGISRNNYGGSFIGYAAGVEVDAGTWKSCVQGEEPVILTKAGTAVKDRDYNVRIVYDWRGEDSESGENDIPQYDIYIDNIKVNDEPIKGYSRNYTGIYMTSGSGQTTYYDDIKYYLPSDDTSCKKSFFITQDPGTSTYTKAQNVVLSTSMTGRDIYYTTDGSYPTLDISSSSATKKYTAPFSVGPDNTIVRAMVVKDGKAESIAYSETYSFVGAPSIRGLSINRKSAVSAEARIYSDTAGKVYYLTSNERITPTAGDVEEEGTDPSVTAACGDTTVITMSDGVNPRSRYAYIVVKDKDGTFSNVLEISMPYERYFYDDFEAYEERGIASEDNFGPSAGYLVNKAGFKKIGDNTVMYGKGVVYDKGMIQYLCGKERIRTGKAVISAKICAVNDNPTFLFGFGTWFKASLYVENGVWKACGYDYYGKQTLDIAGEFVKDTWYDIKLELDIDNNTYDIYVDGVKANSIPLNVYFYNNSDEQHYSHEILFAPTGDATVYIDEVMFYMEEREILKADEPVAVKGLEYNGDTRKGVNYDAESQAYVMSGVTEAKDVGTYTATATLNTGYKWADGTSTPKNIIWAIAPKEVTMTASASDTVYTGNEPTECVITADPSLSGVIETEAEYISLSEASLADVPGTYTDIYAGTGKAVIPSGDFLFELVTSNEEAAKISNYRLIQPVITGNITAATQELTTRKSIPASKGDIISVSELKKSVRSGLDTVGLNPDITFSVISGNEYATYSTTTGLTINANASGGKVVLKAEAGSVDVNGDGVAEYAAFTTGTLIEIIIKSAPKTSQTLSFAKEMITVKYGEAVTGQTAVNDKADGGNITYKSSNEQVVTVDAATGAVTIVSVGSATITASVEATDTYNSDSTGYVIIVEKASVNAPQINSTDETIKGKSDGTIEGLTVDMEYKKAGEAAYTKITAAMLNNGVLSGLAPGVYYVRYAADDNHKASESAAVIIMAYEPEPTDKPVVTPTPKPSATVEPTTEPTAVPTAEPTSVPTAEPTAVPTAEPTAVPTVVPTAVPTSAPTAAPTVAPTPVPTVAPTALPTATPYTEYEYVPVAKKETVIKKTNTDKTDVEGSRLKFLQLAGTPGKNTVTLKWKKIAIADGYIIFGSKCGTKMAKITEITGNSTTKWKQTKLAKGKYYKYMVVAYRDTEEGRKVITSSKSVHVVTDGGKNGNPTALKIKKKNVTFKAGRTFTIKADIKFKKKVVVHVEKLRYESDNTNVAMVSDDGIIMGIKKGKTTIYVYSQNGICGKIKLKVK